MKIFTKILLAVLPLVILCLLITVGASYYFSRSALRDLGETWLDTRLISAMEVLQRQDEMLRAYGLETIPASIVKAKLDAVAQIQNMKIGKLGYICVVDYQGTIIFHPNAYLVGTDLEGAGWARQLTGDKAHLILDIAGILSLVRVSSFEPWKWRLLAVDPVTEVYGIADRMRPVLYSMGLAGALIISLVLLLLTRRLTRPLHLLVRGASEIGRGNLNTRIPVPSQDEFGLLAKGFNQMAFKLQESLNTLQYREEHFRALIENASDLTWVLDARGHFLYASPSITRILGYGQEELLGQNAFDYIHPDDRGGLFQRFEFRVKAIVDSQPMAHRFRHRENFWCTLESVSKNLLDHPAVNGMVINSRNITKRRQAELALEKSHQELELRVEERTNELLRVNKALNNEILIRKKKEEELSRLSQAKGEFLANISHEIRTPLNSVLGFSELLAGMVTEKTQKVYLSTITMAGRNLLALLNDILDLSRLESGRLEIDAAPMSLSAMIREIHALFKMKLAEKGLAFTITLSPSVPAAMILDDMHLRQVLTNLVDNAIKFTESGSVSIMAAAEPSGDDPGNVDLSVKVQDTGPGIPREKKDLVFESFRQESAGTGRKFGGTGLGLAICKQLVSLMGGTIRVDDVFPGTGSCFTVTLTGVEVSSEPVYSAPRAVMDINSIRFSRQTVLVADDQAQIRFMLREILQKLNLEVIEAPNGELAVEAAGVHMPDLILMDAKMPRMNGSDAARKLKANPMTRDIPICLITASIRVSSRDLRHQDLFTDILSKPVIIEDLISVLAGILPDQTCSTPALVQEQENSTRDPLGRDQLDPDLFDRLGRQILPRIESLLQGVRISKAQELAKDLIRIGTECECLELQAFGQRLSEQTQAFDIQQINISLHALARVLTPED